MFVITTRDQAIEKSEIIRLELVSFSGRVLFSYKTKITVKKYEAMISEYNGLFQCLCHLRYPPVVNLCFARKQSVLATQTRCPFWCLSEIKTPTKMPLPHMCRVCGRFLNLLYAKRSSFCIYIYVYTNLITL